MMSKSRRLSQLIRQNVPYGSRAEIRAETLTGLLIAMRATVPKS
jgi:hypothetical protein